MAEQRLIDGSELYGIESLLNTDIVQNSQEASWLMAQVLHDIQASPTIDPEALPIVRQLREELVNKNVELHEAREICEEAKKKYAACAQELKQTQYLYDIAKNAEQQLVKRVEEITWQWAECAKRLKSTKEQLERVTVQRDEAVRDADNARQSLMMAMFAKCEFLVKFDRFGKSVQIVRRADEEEARP